MSQFMHVRIKPITDAQFSEMGIGERSANILRKQPVLGVKERRVQKANPDLNIRGGTLVYLCGGEVGDSAMLWVWEEYTEPVGGINAN